MLMIIWYRLPLSVEFITNNHITEFQDIADIARTEHFDTWHPVLCQPGLSVIIQAYIRSFRFKLKGINHE